MFSALIKACKSFLNRVKTQLKKITKPSAATIAIGALSDLPRSKSDLIAENALLRQQVIVLNRQVKRPQLTTGDRIRLVFMARLTHYWQTALHIVQPDTLLRWHRDLFRLYWKRKSKPTSVNHAFLRKPSTLSNKWLKKTYFGALKKYGGNYSN